LKNILLVILFFSSFIFAEKSIEVDLSEQVAYAIEDGEIVFHGKISSGKKGHRTPTGSYHILQKDKYHRSNQYPKPNGGAKMYYMLRLTNSGIAMHLGRTPKYPASHGCIRMEKGFAQEMYYWARNGINVNVYGDADSYEDFQKGGVEIRYDF